MALSRVDRARIIIDLLKDGVVTTEANYNSSLIDYATPALSLKYADAVMEAYGGYSEAQVAAASNPEKATVFLNELRTHLRDALRIARAPQAAETARLAEEVTVQSEVDTELGTEES